MTITAKTIVNFYSATDTVTNETANNINDATTIGTLIGGTNLVDISNATTDVSIACNIGQRTANDGGGRSAGADTTDEEINAGGIFRDTDNAPLNDSVYVFTFPAAHPDVNIRVYLCTTFASQTSLVAEAVGSNTVTSPTFDSSGNTGGDFVLLENCSPDGSNQITVTTTITGGIGFIYQNGFVLLPAAASSAVPPLATHLINQMRS